MENTKHNIMAFKMKGSAFKLGNVATKSVLKQKSSPVKDMKWWNTNPKDKNDKSKEKAQAHNAKHTTGDDSEHAAPTKSALKQWTKAKGGRTGKNY
jgi:hypothetical protein